MAHLEFEIRRILAEADGFDVNLLEKHDYQEQVGKLVALFEERVKPLREASQRLARLQAAGVDNWEGYSAAFRDEDDSD